MHGDNSLFNQYLPRYCNTESLLRLLDNMPEPGMYFSREIDLIYIERKLSTQTVIQLSHTFTRTS